MSNLHKLLLISDFTIDNFANSLHNNKGFPIVKCNIAPFGQVTQVLIDERSECWKDKPDSVVIWTRPESQIESYKKLLNNEEVSIESVLGEVEKYSSYLLNACQRAKCVFVPMWTLPTYRRGLGFLDMKHEVGLTNILMRMNLKLSEELDKASNVYILNTQKWLELAGKNAFNPYYWYMGKIAFGNEVFVEAAKDIKSALKGINGETKKMIILDLDDTLWGGIVGDIGWENIVLGGHNSIGEAFVDFQRELKALNNRGIILGIVSKNEENIALEAIEKNKEMVLRLKDFAGWRINWNDKAENILDIVSEINIGFQSVVFIDDNPIERARIKDALPEVYVPEWPDNKMLYASTLTNLKCFDSPDFSKEDSKRTEMYKAEQKRKSYKKKVSSLNEWLETLKICVKVEELNESNLQRTAQLINKTNQMNLSTRRLTENELKVWAKKDECKVWLFRVSDSFGDSGLTGLTSFEIRNKQGYVVDLILSCRVMGRKIEDVMLATVIEHARSFGLDKVFLEYIPTIKNKPCFRYLEASDLERIDNNMFVWNTQKIFSFPDYIKVRL